MNKSVWWSLLMSVISNSVGLNQTWVDSTFASAYSPVAGIQSNRSIDRLVKLDSTMRGFVIRSQRELKFSDPQRIWRDSLQDIGLFLDAYNSQFGYSGRSITHLCCEGALHHSPAGMSKREYQQPVSHWPTGPGVRSKYL